MKAHDPLQNPVRFATPNDIEEVLAVHTEAFADIGLNAQNSRLSFTRSISTLGVIKEANSVVAFVQWEQAPGYAYLSWMAVTPKARGKNYGQALIEFVVTSCQHSGCHALGVDSRNRYKSAMILYLKNGFDVVGTYIQTDGELMIRFRKELES